MNKWSECCNAAVLYTHIDGVLEPWGFCKDCLEDYNSYEADMPKEVEDGND